MNQLAFPLPRQLIVVSENPPANGNKPAFAARAAMLELTARLAPHGIVRLLDGGNRFNFYYVARAIRRQTAQLTRALGNIRISRAFTCYQMITLLDETPAAPYPTLVLDLLATFYDESVPFEESRRLLNSALNHLRRLSATAPLVVSIRPPRADYTERLPMLKTMEEAADLLLSPETRPEIPALALF